MRVDGLPTKMNNPVNELWASWGNSALYTDKLRAYLAWQQNLFDDILLSGLYTAVIEVGCGDGSFLMPTAIERSVQYFGLDIEPKAIDALNERLERVATRCTRAEAILGDVHDLERIAVQNQLPTTATLVALPFNAFGNLEDPLVALKAIARYSYDVLVFSYKTDEPTQHIRETYYKNVGITDLKTGEDELGVFFKADGWKSYAYHPHLVLEWLKTVGFSDIQQTDFADFGTACYATR